MRISFTLNHKPITIDAPPDISLLTFLREHLGMISVKDGCDVGECGACSILLDGMLVNSCQLLAPQADGREIITLEGIHAPDGGPTDLQRHFIDDGAVQCGFCIPGMILAGEALLAQNPTPDRAEITDALAGNLCRCTGYIQIVDAIAATARERHQGGSA